MWLIQKPFAYRWRGIPPGRIQLPGFPAAQPLRGKNLRHAPAVIGTRTRHRNQELHRHMGRDGAAANLLLHTLGKQFDKTHATRYPTPAAIETARQLLQPIAEALLQLHQQPTFFQRRFVFSPTQRAVQKQRLGFAQRPDHRLDGVPAQLLQRRNALIAVDHQVSIRLLGRDHHDRRLLAAGRQRGQQPALPLRPAHPKMFKTSLQLMKFQLHRAPARLDHLTLHQRRSGIARQAQ